MDKININLMNGPQGAILTIYEGKALELKHPEKLVIRGQIESVNKYLAARIGTQQAPGTFQHIDKDLAVITVDEDKMTIHLDVDPNNPLGTDVIGQLEHNPELAQFQINKVHRFSRESLLDLLRYSRRFFSDLVEHSNIINALQRLKVSSTGDIGQGSDTRGNKSTSFEKTVNSDAVPKSFVLLIPIYKGQPTKKFQVDICLDTTENNVRFWLESIELIEIADKDKKDIIQAQLADYLDYCIIWK